MRRERRLHLPKSMVWKRRPRHGEVWSAVLDGIRKKRNTADSRGVAVRERGGRHEGTRVGQAYAVPGGRTVRFTWGGSPFADGHAVPGARRLLGVKESLPSLSWR